LSRSFLIATKWHWDASKPAKFLETLDTLSKMKQLLPKHKVRMINFSSAAGIFQNASISNHSTGLEGIGKRRGLQTNKKTQPMPYKYSDCFFASLVICHCGFNPANHSPFSRQRCQAWSQK